MHRLRGHDEFAKTAVIKDKWPIFIKNVCTHLGCPEAASIVIVESKEN